ncbi:MAG: phage tail tape measure protein [Christensenellales bacterium]|jgi:TP901 family phage tail tape measure protein
MAQQRLQTVVTIGGQVDNSFGQIGSALIGLGSQIDIISQKLINFGKESVEKYVNYDDLMREVKALGGYSDSQMQAFDAYNKQIAQNSRHTMEAAASAEGLIAQLGLNIEQTKALLPSVLDLSVSAKTDTAQALDYLYYTLNAFDLELTDAEMLADQMSKTAAIGATEIDTLGRSFQRMGSSLRLFGGGSSEVLAILNGIGQFGDDMQGTKAGTQLRNFMLSLIAPVGKKGDLLDSLEYAGVSLEEYEEYIQETGISTEEAAKTMEMLGFSAYDAGGKIKPAIQIIDELNRSLASYSDQEKNEILGTLFGKRTYVTASNLLSITKEEYEAWQREILYNSDGFTKEMADTMDGGLGGALRELEAAWGAMQKTIGETLAPTVGEVAGFLKDIAVSVANTDPKTLEAIVNGLGTIAVAGPALMTAGFAFRLIGYALTPAGGIGLGLIALASAANALEKLQEADMARNFGTMELDAEALGGFVRGLGEDFKASYTEVNAYATAMDTAVASYTTASETFAGDMLTSMLTASTLTEADKTKLQGLGTEMYTQLTTGMSNATAASMSYWQMLFGGEGEAEYDEDYRAIIDVTNRSYQNLMATAETISRELGQAMDAAFKDGIITGDEYSIIMEKLDAYNKALAEATDKQNYVEFQSLLHKAQTASLDEVKKFAQEIQEERESTLAQEQDRFSKEYYGLEWDFNKSIAAAETEAERQALTQQRDSALATARDYHTQRVQTQSAQYDGVLMRLWESAMGQSDLAGVYNDLAAYADRVLSGEMTQQTALDEIGKRYGGTKWGGDPFWNRNEEREQTGEYLARIIGSLGGYEGLKEKLDYYQGIGNQDMVGYLSRLFLMEGLATKGAYMSIPTGTPFGGWWDGKVMPLEGAQGMAGIDLGQYIADYTIETAKRTIANMDSDGAMTKVWSEVGRAITEQNASIVPFALNDLSNSAHREFDNIIEQLSQVYDFDKVLSGVTSPLADEGSAFRELYAAYSLLYGEASKNPDAFRIQAKVEPVIGDTEFVEMEADVTGQEEAAKGAADEAQGVLDANGLSMEVELPGGGSQAAGFQSAAQAYLSANPGSWHINVVQNGSLPGGGDPMMPKYADGGRADEPSIFGEAGPEWAIPEEHSKRTAALLNEARLASGFTWPELIARTGGLNAGAGRTPMQLVYAPTIHAADARGVEQKLLEDKERMERWLRDKQLMDEMEVYA